ncbi:MAG: ATP-dependent DNA helicase [Methanobrevibacter sp.]|uniref:ATP-dependent DNA helicase n=1 Tax=Methanobrevibacter sp. TaxID=66852 RepID=UPI003F00E769
MVKLDDKQEKVVYYEGNNPLSVEAGPGAGKTRVIIERVKYLLNELKIKPETLLIITFTRKAAEELKERLADSEIPKSDIDLMQISTIHGFCSRILEQKGNIGFDVIDDDLSEKTNLFVSKHLKDLGFVDEYRIPSREVKNIVNKYNEYTTFNVDSEKLIDYIKKTRPISEEYVDFVKNYLDETDGKFPTNEIKEDDELKKSYYNARYLKIAESYPTYLELLKKENLIDFALMQVKVLEILEEEPETPFENIMIDEFQDTDPVQMRIFEILMNNANTFTVVGDIEQSIYGFRGSLENYFDKLYKHSNVERKELSYNYRSTDEIIDFTQDFITIQRSEDDNKSKAIGKREKHRDVYYMDSDNKKTEADKIIDLIEHLKTNNKIEEYNEIGILVRSVKNNSNCINPLIENLKKRNIPYQVKGRKDLLERDEIKSILTLFFYIIKNNESNHIFNSWQKDWLNLKAFTGANFNQILVNLSDETKNILNCLQDKFEQDVIEMEKIIYKEFTGEKSRIRTYSGVFNRDEEILIEIFNRVKFPSLENKYLEGYGITNKDDLEFFYSLNSIRNDYLSALEGKIEYNDQPTVLDIFIKLLTMIGCLNEKFINNNESIVENIALLSNTLYNYEHVRNSKDLAGAFWFVYHNIEDYGSTTSNDGVQIMTVHKSKGLEFPIVIVASIEDKKFPLEFKDPNPENGYINGRPVYYTPNDCLEYNPFKSIEEEKEAHDAEEERVIYVAMTRAQDTLILSCLGLNDGSVTRGHENIKKTIDLNSDYCKELNDNYDVIEKTICDKPKNNEESIKLSFTSIQNYIECPFRYRLEHEFNLKTTENKYIDAGNFIHKAFEIINKKIIDNDNNYIGDEEVKNIVSNLFERSNFKIEDEEKRSKLNSFIKDILYYYNNVAGNLKIIDSEVSFYIKKDNYSLNGFIDLIYETKDGKIGILDYKNTKSEKKYLKKYKMQLYTYILGLRDETNKFKDMEIGELSIYAIKSKKLVTIPINNDEINDWESKIDETVLNIENKNFSSVKSKSCTNCQYLDICN